ncbi:MAG: R3H domain-containing nucleic acid-binding protein [Trueperaceae bacterium]
MADNDLDKYLENIGISVDEDENEAKIPESREAAEEAYSAPAGVLIEGDPRERTESFLVHLLLNFDPSYAVDITYGDEGPEEQSEVTAEIYGGDPGKIIGRNGRTLAALEYLTNAVINRQEGSNVRVSVDVGGYKRRRDDRLREAAFKAADRVRKSGDAVELDPMSAAERRVIHVALADESDVATESSGEGRARRVVIRPS